MAMAANLANAAVLSYDQTSLAWNANTLKAKFAAFCTTTAPIFSDSSESDRPVGNWLVPMWSLSQVMTASPDVISESQFNQLAQYVWAMCYAAAFAQAQNRITGAQAAALLAAWNTNFGT